MSRRQRGLSLAWVQRAHSTWFDRIENGERRWTTVGISANWNTLIIAHTVIEEDEDGNEVIRIISARPADRTERKRYEHG